MDKFKSKLKRPRLISILILVLLMVVAHAAATPNDFHRIGSTNLIQSEHVAAQQKEPVKTAVDAPNVNPPKSVELKTEPTPVVVPEPTPIAAPAPVDPNGCEAKGMWYRADNNECVAKPVPVSTPTPSVAAPQTQPTGTGDCSLVNAYDWPVATATRVCMQESGGNPNNANWLDNHMSWAGCMGSFGLFQINCSHGQVYDGAANVAIAYSMWKGSGGTFVKYWPNTCRIVGC